MMQQGVQLSDREKRGLYLTVGLSLLLVTLATVTDPVLNRDGMYYVDAARALLAEQDSGTHDWLFLPALFAAVAGTLQVDVLPVALAYSLLTSVLLCVVMYLWLQALGRGAAPWLAVFVALTSPWALSYQSYVIRDSAAWVAIATCLLFACYWTRTGQWRWLLLMVPVTGVAFLFRTEMLVLLAVPAWLLSQHLYRRGRRHFFAGLAGAGLMALLVVFAGRDLLVGHATFYLAAIEKQPELMMFPEFAADLATHVNPYVRSDIETVLALGLLMLPVVGVAGLLSLHALPFVAALWHRGSNPVMRRDGGTSFLMALVFLMVVLAFLYLMQFVVGRYLVPVALCLTPWVYQGTAILQQHYPRLLYALVTLSVLSALSASVSLGPGKGFMRDAGAYVAAHHEQLAPVYYTDARIAFYAGARYLPKRQLPLDKAAPQQLADSRSLVLVYKGDEDELETLLDEVRSRHGFSERVYSRDNGDGYGVVILSR